MERVTDAVVAPGWVGRSKPREQKKLDGRRGQSEVGDPVDTACPFLQLRLERFSFSEIKVWAAYLLVQH